VPAFTEFIGFLCGGHSVSPLLVVCVDVVSSEAHPLWAFRRVTGPYSSDWISS